MKKKVKKIVHGLLIFLMVSGTSTPLVVSGEQLVHSKESKENSSSTNFEISTEGTNDATNNVSTSSTESINSSQTAEQEEATTDQTQDSMENNESETDQTQDNAENNESETNQTQETTEQDEPPTVDDSPEVTKQAQDDEEAEINAIGKGENFNGKLYLNYFGKKVKNVFATSAIPAVGLMRLVINQIMEKNVKERFDVGVDTIQNLITTYILYDIAFAKDSSLMSLANSQNDGTTPAENTGFYPNTQQIKGTALNNQDGKMMDLYAYYVNQNSDKTVIIHGGFRGNWNNGIVMDEYNDFYQAGYNMIFVDSRATGTSGGDFVTYGQYESDDVLYWINRETSERPQQKILLYGGSMGAATMMSVLAKNIPTNVKGIIENCGFKSIDEQLRFTYSSTVAPLLSNY
ncbi:alpha/beta fold hydrolase [Enterococcus ratti]